MFDMDQVCAVSDEINKFCALTAMAVAQQQKARSFELRAAMSLVRLWRDHGKGQQALELLAPVYGWFTKGSTRAI